MKTTDLMIGDWVLLNGDPRQVSGICLDEDTREYSLGFLDKNKELYLAYENYDRVDPIPLTREILEKNGVILTAVGDDGVSTPKKNRMRYEKFECKTEFQDFIVFYDRLAGRYSVNFYYNTTRDITSVHELQHALRIFGIKKEIQL